MEIKFNKYGTIISDKEIGEQILNTIRKSLSVNNKVIINLSGVLSMATFCAKQIFGTLYIELTSEVFFERIEFINVTDDLKLLIKIGIQNALEDEANKTCSL